MSTMTAPRFAQSYRTSLWGTPDPLFRRCLKIAGAVGVLFLAVVYLTPRRSVEITSVDQVPDRIAKLILDEPAPAPALAPPKPVAEPKPEVVMEQPKDVPKPKPEPTPVPRNVGQRRQTPPQPVPEDRGTAGREMAQKQVTQQLAAVTGALETTIADLETALSSSDDGQPRQPRRRARRATRRGRSASDLAGVATPVTTVETDAAASSIGGARIAVETIAELEAEDFPGGTSGAATRNEHRSDASLLAVVRRYAPGIRFCYDNELKKAPGLGGKLVVSITVAASGRVTEAVLVKDTVGSAGLTSCALLQIEAWKFPAIPEGTVTFQAPFVFTPPE